MKTKNLVKKLSLNKKTIIDLNARAMGNAYAGGGCETKVQSGCIHTIDGCISTLIISCGTTCFGAANPTLTGSPE